MYKNETTPLFICNGDDEMEMKIRLDNMNTSSGFVDIGYHEEDEYDYDETDFEE